MSSLARSWEVERHSWTAIDASLAVVPSLLDALAAAATEHEVEAVRWTMESLFVPNGVVERGAPEFATCMIQSFWSASRPSQFCILQFVSYFAAGSVRPTSADPRVLMRMADVLRPMLPVAAEVVQRSDDPEQRHIAVDILDSMYHLYPSERDRITFILRRFGETGPQEARRVLGFLRDIGTS